MTTIVEVIVNPSNLYIDVITQQPLTVEEINSFRSVPVGVNLTASGDGDQYLSDDGTYKPVGAGSAANLSIANKTGTTLDILSSSGTDVTIPEATTTEAGLFNAGDKVKLNGLATVATSGSYADLTGTPTIPAAQVNSDWNSVSGVSQILNKPPLGTVSPLNVPASGNAASGEVVKGNDTRLSDARTPTTHTHTASETTDFNTAADARVAAGIAGKEDTITAGTTAQYWRGDKSWQTLNSTAVGLSNVNNTSDANKPVSTATQTALNLKYDASNPSGYTTNLGTVTTVSVVSANGFAGSVATAGTTPAITLTLQNATTGQSGQLTSTDWNTFNGKQDTLISGTSIKTINGTSLLGSGDVVISGGGLSLTEIEVDFGSKPIKSKKFTITDASITGASKIIVSPSGNVATGRVGDDWEWDSISTSAKAGTGQFVLTCFASGKVAGKRKFYYTYQ